MTFATASLSVCGAGNIHVPPYYSRASFFNRPIGPGDSLAADQSQAQHVANQIQYGRSGHTFFGYSGVGYGNYPWPGSVGFIRDQFTFPIYAVRPSDPSQNITFQKVGLWIPANPDRPLSTQGNLQAYMNAVPMPDVSLCPRITGVAPYLDLWSPAENGCVIWNRDTDEAWELYGATRDGPADMQQALGCTYLARGGAYIPSMSNFGGAFLNQWGSRATSLGAAGGLITMQDLRDVFNGGTINHALCFGAAMNGGHAAGGVPPASRADGPGSLGNNVPLTPSGAANPAYQHDVSYEGGHFRFPANVSLANITTMLGKAMVQAIRDYGKWLVDTTGAVGFYVEDSRTLGSPYHLQGASAPDPQVFAWPNAGGSAFANVLTEFPWDQLQVLTPVNG